MDTFGLRYDTVENHGWYRNLDPTVEDLARHLEDGQLLGAGAGIDFKQKGFILGHNISQCD